MAQTETEIVNKLGLHARAAAKLTEVATGFAAEVWLSRNGRRVNAKSSRVLIEAEGEDADAAVSALARLIAERFGEEE
jgi:phosphocarrier protein